MLEQSEIFELNRKYLFGRVVTSTVAKAHIAAIEIPSDRRYPDITVVYATDLGSCNYVDVMGTKVPILASDEVSYEGQPVMAVFGPEDEDVELFCKEVKISYKIEPEAEANASEVYGEPFSWSYGNTSDFFVQGAKTVKSTFTVAAHESKLLGGQRVFAVLEDGVMNLQLETQWPVNVRKSVANALGYPLDKVCVNAQPNEASYDQFIFSPTVLSCLAAVAAEKTNSPVQICAPLVSYQPGLNFKFETVVNHDEGCLAGRFSCTVNMGAFPVFTQEVFNNILAGLVPVYPMKALDVKVTIVKSPSAPANFFGDLGFAMAQAASENHFTQVALALDKQPGLWRLELLKACGNSGPAMSEKARQSKDFEKLHDTLENVITDSWYSRKSAANMQKNLSGIKVNPLVNYSKGIGIATGEGIMGFSQKFNVAMKYSLSVTLTEDNQVIVNTGIQAGKNIILIWKQTIKQYLDVPEDDITFLDINDPRIIDIGPNVLSRKMGVVTSLLIQACSEIARKKEFSRLPITVTAVSEPDDSDFYYHCSCFGSVAVELHVDTITLCPVIDNVWARFYMGHVYDKQKLINRARLSIFTVISEVFPNISWQFNIDLKVIEDANFGQSSITLALRGLTISALIGAVSQALGRNVNFLPIKASNLLTLLKGTPATKEAETTGAKAAKVVGAKVEEAKATDIKVEGTKVDGVKTDSAKVDSAKADGVKAPEEDK